MVSRYASENSENRPADERNGCARCGKLDGSGQYELSTAVPFLDHMLSHVAMHGLLDLTVRAQGDIEVDDHHTVEDIGICLGQVLKEALGDKRGIVRFAHHVSAMDEALVLVAVDISGRGMLVYDVAFPQPVSASSRRAHQGILQALAVNGGLCLHVKLLYGGNAHHIAEAVFKALGRCLGAAVQIDPRKAAWSHRPKEAYLTVS